jgi:hypothetical protein
MALVICPTVTAKNFSRKDWTAQIGLSGHDKFDFWCTRFLWQKRRGVNAAGRAYQSTSASLPKRCTRCKHRNDAVGQQATHHNPPHAPIMASSSMNDRLSHPVVDILSTEQGW